MEYRLQSATHIQRRPDGGPTVEYRLRPATHIQRRPDVVVLSGISPKHHFVHAYLVTENNFATANLVLLPACLSGSKSLPPLKKVNF